MYLTIKELANSAQDIIMVISSLSQDMNTLPVLKANALRALGAVMDPSMISGIERIMKQAIGDKSTNVMSSALTTSIHLFGSNKEAVKRWLPEVQACLNISQVKTTAQYHALGLLYMIKQNDKVALNKLVQQIQAQSTNALATCLNLRIYGQLLSMDDSFANNQTPLDLRPYLRLKGKSDMVALEAARTICEHHEIYSNDVVFAITALQMFLTSGKPLLRFAAIRALNDFANIARQQVSICNVEIESLVADPNRNIATLAITTLLKTGNEASVDRLITQIMGYVSEITDEFKIIVVDAVRSLGLKFPGKYKSMLLFLGSVLREEGGLEYKEATVNAIFQLLANIPEARESAISHLCEFIEDCEYPALTSQILHLFGEEGPRCENPSILIRYIYNRLILEDSIVRVAAVGALIKLAASCPSIRPGIVSILNHCIEDEDDLVRDRAVIGVRGLSDDMVIENYFVDDNSYDLEMLESQLLQQMDEMNAALPFNIENIKTLSKLSLFESARVNHLRSSSICSKNTNSEAAPISSEQVVPKIFIQIDQIPEFSSFGKPFSSSKHVALTESETEYVVIAKKHVFHGYLILEFECRNTVKELFLENVQVKVQSAEGLEPFIIIPIPKLSFDDPKSCYVAFKFDTTTRPSLTFNCSLVFTASEVDIDTGNVLNRGSEDVYAIDNLNLTLSDYLRARSIEDFICDWNAMEYEEIETFELSNMKNIQESVKAIVQLVGIRAYQNTDKVEFKATTHILQIVASVFDGVSANGSDVAIRVRLINTESGVAAELAVKSFHKEICRDVINAIC